MLKRWFSLTVRNRLARLMLLVGVFGPGIALGFASSIWGTSALFLQMASLPIPLFIWGFMLILCGLVIIFIDKWRDVAYVCVAAFYVAASISGGFVIWDALVHTPHQPASALIFALPVLVWIYLEASLTATREQDKAEVNNVLQALRNPEPIDRED